MDTSARLSHNCLAILHNNGHESVLEERRSAWIARRCA